MACLQPVARPALACGLAAAVLKALRCASKEDFSIARWASGTLLLIQASYFSIYSSHSATPILSPVAVSVLGTLVVVFAGLLTTTALFPLLVVVGAELQLANPIVPISRTAFICAFLFN